MAEKHSPTAAKPATPIEVDEILCQVDKVKALNDLAAWVGRSRDRNRSIDFHAVRDRAFADRLKGCDFAENYVDWDADVAEGMEALHGAIEGQLCDIRKALEAGR